MRQLRTQFGCNAVLFWNELRADRVAVVFRPKQFLAQSFTVLQARHKLLVIPEQAVTSKGGSEETASAPLHSTLVNVSQVLASMVESSLGVIESFDLK